MHQSRSGFPERLQARLSARLFVLVAVVVWCLDSTALRAQDWPTYRHDAARTGSTTAVVQPANAARWTYRAAAPPRMAWSSAEGRVIENHLIGHLVKYDDAIHPVVVGQRMYFGSSVDHHLHCLDLATGAEIWTFATGGPIRLAPTVSQNRVYFGSDDGIAWCVSADDGQLIWKQQAGPAGDWLLARGEMISRWPVRTSVLVDQGVAWFGAGIFPHEDVYLYAVDAADGKILWRQDNISVQDAGRNDLSPQGYLLASADRLFVPSGRSLPAAFDRRTGELIHKRTHSWRTTAGGVVGGVQALLADDQIYASGPHHWLAMTESAGDVGFGWFAGRQIVVQAEQAYVATGEVVARLDRLKYAVNSRRRHELEMLVYDVSRRLSGAGDQADELRRQISEAQKELLAIADVGVDWQIPLKDEACLMTSGDMVFVGGHNRVTGLAKDTGKQLWQAEVDGDARGLVLAAGHLLVSTSAGLIYAFPAADAPAVTVAEAKPPEENPWPADDLTAIYERAAEEILQQLGSRRGFCLIAGNGEGRLAFELAKRSDLQIYAVDADADQVQKARQRLSQTGLYGRRIVVHQADPAAIPYSNYFANLVTSDSFLKTGQLPPHPELLTRHVKPLGGRMILGRPSGSTATPPDFSSVLSWFDQTGLQKQSSLNSSDNWNTLTRGALPGAGNWSHQYGSPSNTAVSTDTRVKTDLGVLWYGDPGPGEMVNRHEGAVGPLATNGRLFVQGEWSIMAYDAYNGLFLWKHENPEALRTGVFQNQNPANLAATDDRLFHFIRDQCFELDAATGETLRIHRLPKSQDGGEHEWGYVATQNGLLLGAATVRKELETRERRRGRRTSDATDVLFAIDLQTGQHLWTYQGQSISHHTIALSPDKICFIDSSITSEQREALLRQDKSHLEQLTGAARELAEQRAKDADVRRAVALEVRTGRQLWESTVDVTDCSEIGAGGGKLSLMYQDGVLLLGGANANGHYWKQFVAGEFSRRRLVALSAEDGYKLWSKDANYKGRPIVLGQKVLAEPWAFDLHSGEQQMRKHPLTGEQVPWSLMRTGHHCGMLTGCDSGMLLFRSGDTAFYDMEADEGTKHFAGHRLGCWINAIAANGLIMIPEASAGCVCQFSIASTIVMEPRDTHRRWMIHSAVGAKTPVQSMAIAFGAPGDRTDGQGNLWLSYPRRKAYQETALDVALDFKPVFLPAGRFSGISETSVQVRDSQAPWLYASWAEGLQQLTVPLLGPDDKPAVYGVKLHFSSAGDDQGRPVVFDVQLQGKTVLENVSLEAGANGLLLPTIAEAGNIQVSDNLTVQLLPRQGVPRLHALEVVRQQSP